MRKRNKYTEAEKFDLFLKTNLKSCFCCDMEEKEYLRFKQGKNEILGESKSDNT